MFDDDDRAHILLMNDVHSEDGKKITELGDTFGRENNIMAFNEKCWGKK